MTKVIVIDITFGSGAVRSEGYRNTAAGRVAARDCLRYHMQMCLQGDTKSVTMSVRVQDDSVMLIEA